MTDYITKELAEALRGALTTLDMVATTFPEAHAGVIRGAFILDEPKMRVALAKYDASQPKLDEKEAQYQPAEDTGEND